MKTENLVEALVTDHAKRGVFASKPMRWALVGALASGGLVSLALFFIAFGVRPDIAAALRSWRFDFKVGLVLVALALAFSLCIALSRPVTSGQGGLASLPLRHWPWRRVAIVSSPCCRALFRRGPAAVGSNAFDLLWWPYRAGARHTSGSRA